MPSPIRVRWQRARARLLLWGAFVLTAIPAVPAEAAQPRPVVILPIKAPDGARSIYGDYLAVVIRRLGIPTVSLGDVGAQLRLVKIQRMLTGCVGAACVQATRALDLDLDGDEIVSASIVRDSKTSTYLVVMTRLDTATGVALGRFEGEAATTTALRQTLRRGARVLFGRQIDPAAVGALLVQTKPERVAATLDGRAIGRTPIVLERVAAGDHELVLTSRTARVIRPVFIEPGAVTPVRISMNRPPATVHIFSDPPGAQVMCNDEIVGRSPVILEDVTATELDLQLEKPGFRPINKRVRLASLDAEARRVPVVALSTLQPRWPIGLGTLVGTTFDARAADAGTGFSIEAHADLFNSLQVGVGYAHPTTVFGSLRLFPWRTDLEIGWVARIAGVQLGGRRVPSNLRRWDAAFMAGIAVAYSVETRFGRLGLLAEGGPSFLATNLDRWTVPVTVAGLWRFR